jgi:signal peptidase II
VPVARPATGRAGAFALAGLVIVADQVSKWLALHYLAPYEPVALLPGLNATLLFNTGAAFSFLSDAGGWQHWLFLLLAFVVALALAVWLWRGVPERGVRVALALLLGGALGNAIDRLYHGHVVDFIDVYAGRWHWPAFNLADSAITVGVLLLLWTTRRQSGPPG